MTDTTNTALTVIETPTDMVAELTIEQAREMVERLQYGIKHAEEWHLTSRSTMTSVSYTHLRAHET